MILHGITSFPGKLLHCHLSESSIAMSPFDLVSNVNNANFISHSSNSNSIDLMVEWFQKKWSQKKYNKTNPCHFLLKIEMMHPR